MIHRMCVLFTISQVIFYLKLCIFLRRRKNQIIVLSVYMDFLKPLADGINIININIININIINIGRWAVCRYFCQVRAVWPTEWSAVSNPGVGNQRFCNYVYMYMSALLCNIYA